MTYTAAAVVGAVATVLLDLLVLRTRLLTQQRFWVAYAVVLGFQLLTNGVLTCTDTVVYDAHVITGVRVACAPVEDLLFGFALVVQTLAWWTFWGERLSSGPGSRS